jgi:hypothetical protein
VLSIVLEVSALSLGEFHAQSGILGLFHLEDANDSSGHGYNLNSLSVAFVNGRFKKAAYFDQNVNHYLSYSGASIGNVANDLSVSMHFAISSNSIGTQPLLCWKTYVSVGRRLEIMHSSISGLYITARGSAIYSNVILQNGVFYHIDVSIIGSTAYLYINGELVASGSVGTTSAGAVPQFYLGKSDLYTYSLGGLIDEVALFNYGRTAAQIKKHYAHARGMLA